MWVAFAIFKAINIFLAKILAYMLNFDGQSFNDTVTNDNVSFEQLDPVFLHLNLG